MPEISRFFGIVIRMHFDDHRPPHFHATYGESRRLNRFANMPAMLRISDVPPLGGRLVQLTLTDGSVVERDLSSLLDGVGVFERISFDDAAFREVYVDYGTLAWPGDVDIAPETLIWDGPDPADKSRRPEAFLRPQRPSRAGLA